LKDLIISAPSRGGIEMPVKKAKTKKAPAKKGKASCGCKGAKKATTKSKKK